MYVWYPSFMLLLLSFAFGQTPALRTAFTIPLVRLSAYSESGTTFFKRIHIQGSDPDEYSVVARYTDYHIENARSNEKKITYDENPSTAHLLSQFEAEQLGRVLKSFLSTLELFENDLKQKRWDRCLYLDAFFPKFMKNFYYLSCAQFNSNEVFPAGAQIADTLFDASLISYKSDRRIHSWRKRVDYPIRLQIATRELGFHFKKWEKETLKKAKSSKAEVINYNTTIEDAYTLFIKTYFNM